MKRKLIHRYVLAPWAIALAVCFSLIATAQEPGGCDPVNVYMSDPGIYPIEVIEQCVVRGEEFSSAIYFKNFEIIDGTIFGLPGLELDIVHAQITNIENFPSGISYDCNMQDCLYPRGETGCMNFSGITEDQAGFYQLGFVGLLIANASNGQQVTLNLTAEDFEAMGIFYHVQVIEQTDICPSSSEDPCTVPADLTAGPITTTGAKVNWEVASNADHYRIRGRQEGHAEWGYWLAINGGVSSVNITDLEPNKNYEWQINAFCDYIETWQSGWSDVQTFTTGCYAPESLWVAAVSANAARLKWTANPGAEGFQIIGRREGAERYKRINVEGNADHYDLAFLEPNETYEWTIKTICGEASGISSELAETHSFTTAEGARTIRGEINPLGGDDQTLSVYPNPASNKLWIQIPLDVEPESVHLQISFMNGDEVPMYGEPQITGQTISVWVGHLPVGIYNVSVSSERYSARQKILILR